MDLSRSLRLSTQPVLMGGPWKPTSWLFRDEFLTDEAAPLASPRTAEPGPGTMGLVQSGANDFSISSGKLIYPGGVAQNTEYLHCGSFARAIGRALIFKDIERDGTGSWYPGFGWNDDSSPALQPTFALCFFSSADLQSTVGGQVVGSYAADTDYDAAFIQRSAGGFIVWKDAGIWKLLWVDNDVIDDPMYPAMHCRDIPGSVGAIRVCDLPAPWDTDYGIATQRLAGNVLNDTPFSHEADCFIEYTETLLGGTGSIWFRVQDDQNHWRVVYYTSGNLYLYEVVGDTPTTRGTSAGVVSAGSQLMVRAEDEEIKIWVDGNPRITYSSASNFKDRTSGKVVVSNQIADLITWPRVISGTARKYLEGASK